MGSDHRIGERFQAWARSPVGQRLKRWLGLPTMPSLDEQQQQWRIFVFERDIGLVVKAVVLATLFYFFYWSGWQVSMPAHPNLATQEVTWTFARKVVQHAFIVYLAVNIGAAFVLAGMQEVSRPLVRWTVFTVALIDALFLGALTVITGGLHSPLYWLYLLLIVRNCVSVSALVPQIGLNLFACFSFALAAGVELSVARMDRITLDDGLGDAASGLPLFQELGGPFVLRMLLLVGVGVWCHGFQFVLDRQRSRVEEQHELELRRNQLAVSGRLAAEIAHQLKNPLAIINNASFTLQKTLKEGKTITQQIRIIREEVARSDRLITELMGYAKLTEGHVEKLNVREEVEEALAQVFPPAVNYEVKIHREHADALPPLLAQRNHLREILVNIMQNAREAMQGKGQLWVKTAYGESRSIVITIADDGPGIPPKMRERIFEPYISTREFGTGLGLAIAKHNTEMYGGKVRVESELGKGTTFILEFPARTVMRLRQ